MTPAAPGLPRRGRHRLFFAIKPDAAGAAALAARAAALRRQHGLAGRGVDAEKLHLTLQMLGDFADLTPVAAASAAAADVVAEPFDVVLDMVGSFARRQASPLVMRPSAPSPGLLTLQRTLAEALARAGFEAEARPWTPHATLMYEDTVLPWQPIEPVAWHQSEFLLVHSAIGQGRHSVLARWPLPSPRLPAA